jgi:hypothetical protein
MPMQAGASWADPVALAAVTGPRIVSRLTGAGGAGQAQGGRGTHVPRPLVRVYACRCYLSAKVRILWLLVNETPTVPAAPAKSPVPPVTASTAA